MKWRVQHHPGTRRIGWQGVEVFEGTRAEAVALIEARSAEDGRPWRLHEWVDPASTVVTPDRLAGLNQAQVELPMPVAASQT